MYNIKHIAESLLGSRGRDLPVVTSLSTVVSLRWTFSHCSYAMDKGIRLWAQTCDACHRNKTHRHIKTHNGKLCQLSRRFKVKQIQFDSVDPLPQAEGCVFRSRRGHRC